MSDRTLPLFYWCKHLEIRSGYYCKAFAKTSGHIPDEIWRGEFDHHKLHPHDNGTNFEQAEMQKLVNRDEFQGATQQEITDLLVHVKKGLEAFNAMEDIQAYWDRYFASDKHLSDDFE